MSPSKKGKSASLRYAHPAYKSKFENEFVALPVLESLSVHVSSTDESLQYGVDESYVLNGE